MSLAAAGTWNWAWVVSHSYFAKPADPLQVASWNQTSSWSLILTWRSCADGKHPSDFFLSWSAWFQKIFVSSRLIFQVDSFTKDPKKLCPLADSEVHTKESQQDELKQLKWRTWSVMYMKPVWVRDGVSFPWQTTLNFGVPVSPLNIKNKIFHLPLFNRHCFGLRVSGFSDGTPWILCYCCGWTTTATISSTALQNI